MIERKCLSCGTWNKEEKFCTTCSAPLAPEEIDKVEDAKREQIRLSQPKPQLDVLLDKAKNSKYLLVRGLFYVMYSVAFVVFAISAFLAYLVAWTPA